MIIEQNLRVSSGGNLSLGQSGYDDGQGDTTHKYAKADCRLDLMQDLLNRPLADALPTTNLTESRTRTSAGIWSRVYTAGGAVASFTRLIVPELIRTGITSGTAQVPQAGAYALHGYKLTSVDIDYSVSVLAPTSIVVTAQTETAQTNNVARANASTTALGTVTYQNPVGTTVSVLPVATQANPYQCRVAFGTPIFCPVDNLTLEIAWTMVNTNVVTVTGLWANFSYAPY